MNLGSDIDARLQARPPSPWKGAWLVCREAATAWVDDEASSMGAAIAYYTVFSIAPLLVIVIAVAGLVWGPAAVHGAVAAELSGLLGPRAADAIQAMVRAAALPDEGWYAGLIGLGVVVVGATSVFVALQSALDRIWEVPKNAKPSGAWALLRARLFSFGLILGIGFLLIVSLVLNALVTAFGHWASARLPGADLLLFAVNELISLGLSTLLLAMIFRFMPSAKVAWQDVWLGAAVTAVLLAIGKVGIGYYLATSSTVNAYTAAGSVVILLVWVYYAAQIFLFGAEVSWAYAKLHGSRRAEREPGKVTTHS